MQEKLVKKSARIDEIKTVPSTYIQLLYFKSIGPLIGCQLVVFGFIMNFLVVYTNRLPPAWFSTFPEQRDKDFYFSLYLTKPWAHLSTFMIGLLAGCLARCLAIENGKKLMKIRRQEQQQKQLNPFITNTQSSPSPSCSSASGKFRQLRAQSNSTINGSHNGSTMILTMSANSNNQIPDEPTSRSRNCAHQCKRFKWSLLSGWLMTLSPIIIMLAIIYSTFSWSTRELPGNFVSALYDSVSRILWSSCLSFMLTRWTLTSQSLSTPDKQTALESVWLFLGRLSLISFLISPLINNFLLAVQEQAIFSSIFIIFHLIVGNTLIIYTISFLVAILIEQPITRFVAYVICFR